jgi:hypothetical protein
VDQSAQNSVDSSPDKDKNSTYVSFLSPLRDLSQSYEIEEERLQLYKAPTTLRMEMNSHKTSKKRIPIPIMENDKFFVKIGLQNANRIA